ncbi:hypothetical protein IFM89_002215 [Coptis chinensis]|uniref:Uncharacterized protein n=1 Tax=Coptis chinensis TaxID=261450 RepID=A0A835I952_9MAGN|nr:hypothetical protein IFM89_002215 [Coptis chinensis]
MSLKVEVISKAAIKPSSPTPPHLRNFKLSLVDQINGNEVINCTDEGVNFFEARVHCELSHVLNHPIAEELDKLLPRDNFYGLGSKPLLSIQVNIFGCGGMALGVQGRTHGILKVFS